MSVFKGILYFIIICVLGFLVVLATDLINDFNLLITALLLVYWIGTSSLIGYVVGVLIKKHFWVWGIAYTLGQFLWAYREHAMAPDNKDLIIVPFILFITSPFFLTSYIGTLRDQKSDAG